MSILNALFKSKRIIGPIAQNPLYSISSLFNSSISESLKNWKLDADKELKGKDFNTLLWKTDEGIQVKPLFTSCDMGTYSESLPGRYPYLRGPYATMYTIKPWTIRQYAGFSTAEESNKFYRNNLAKGQRGLSVAFDLPTHCGYDSDNPLVKSDVGMAGVAIDSVEDMKILFDGIPLDQMSVSMTMNGAVIPILAMYIVAAEENGIPSQKLTGTIQNDILKEFIVRNTYIYPPLASLRLTADIFEYTNQYIPKFNSISISGYHMEEAGADCVLELAFTLCNGLEYLKLAQERNLKLQNIASRFSFFFGVGMNYYMEVAKLRAARKLWSALLSERYQLTGNALKLRTHCQTSGWSLSRQDPYNNVIRTTVEALAAAHGGTQSLHTNSLDEAVALPSISSSRIARNTQIILQEEAMIGKVIDPWAGSYFMENLTDEIYNHSMTIIKEVDDLGGMVNAIESGYAKRRIEESATKKQARIDSGDITIVGVNKYQITEEEDLKEVLNIDNSEVLKKQTARILKTKQNRNETQCQQLLSNLSSAAESNENIMVKAIECVRARCTLGEISDSLEKVFGRYKSSHNLLNGTYCQTYCQNSKHRHHIDNIIAETKRFESDFGRRPRILVAKLGLDGHDRGMRIVASSFSDFGFDVDLGPMFATPQEILQLAQDNDVQVIGVSTLAAAHRTLLPELMELIKLNEPHIMVVAGGVIPPGDLPNLYKIGISQIFHPGTSLVDAGIKVLEQLRKKQ